MNLTGLRARLARLAGAVPVDEQGRPLHNSEEMIRAANALVAELAAQGIEPRPSLGSDEADIARALSEIGITA